MFLGAFSINSQHSGKIAFFDGELIPQPNAVLVGYSALIAKYQLHVVKPEKICAVAAQHTSFTKGRWQVFGSRYMPNDTLKGHLTFALKYEGIDLAVLNDLFTGIAASDIEDIVINEPTGAYSRRIWFLYEWLLDKILDLPNLTKGSYVALVNEKQQYAGPVRQSSRHRINNDLPGVKGFCPLISRSATLDALISADLSQQAKNQTSKVHTDLLSRAAAFLLLKDSKASYTIEGESPPHSRVERWGRIIGQAGSTPLCVEEIERLQEVVIPDGRFILRGIRLTGGFIGDHDRATGIPIPAHISAKYQDLDDLMAAFFETYQLLKDSDFDPVLMATIIAFGFVFIHPLEDGNGRIHRYLLHHVLADKDFVPKGLVFPVSAAILEHIADYKTVLECFSKPRLDLIEWHPTAQNNVDVINQTIDLYRFCDLTKQAVFLYQCVEKTVLEIMPKEVKYLQSYDQTFNFINNYLDIPDKVIHLLISFLNQNNGTLSKRARNKKFDLLTDVEISTIENKYQEAFGYTDT